MCHDHKDATLKVCEFVVWHNGTACGTRLFSLFHFTAESYQPGGFCPKPLVNMVQVTVYFRGWKAALICLENLDGAVAGTKVEVTLLGKCFCWLVKQQTATLCRGFKNCWQMLLEKTELKCLEVQVRSHQCIANVARRQCRLVVISAHSTTLKAVAAQPADTCKAWIATATPKRPVLDPKWYGFAFHKEGIRQW